MEGSCQCGAVKFTTPMPKPSMLFHCHCLNCQKQSASAFGTSAMFPTFTLPPDAPVGVYDNPHTKSGRVAKCYFCKNCGSRILHDRGTGTVSVKGGLLEGLDWSNGVHIWTKRARVPIPEGATQYPEEPPA